MEWLDGPRRTRKDMAARVNTETDQVIASQTSKAVWQPGAIAAELFACSASVGARPSGSIAISPNAFCGRASLP